MWFGVRKGDRPQKAPFRARIVASTDASSRISREGRRDGRGPTSARRAPGIGYPTGWNDPSVVWGPTQSLGLGLVYVWNSPVESQSWGSIKSMFK